MKLSSIALSILALSQLLFGLETSFKADSLHGTLGDVISFSWDVQHGPETEISIGDIKLDGTGIEILDQSLTPTDLGSQLSFQTAIYDSVGIYQFPVFTIYSRANNLTDSLLLQGPNLQVLSVLTASDTLFRDIKGLHRVSTSINLTILIWTLIIALIVYLLYYYFQGRTAQVKMTGMAEIIPPEAAHVIALRSLEHLKQSDYLKKKKFKLFHSELTHILKQYYENRFLVDALDRTTSELLHNMESFPEFDQTLILKTQRILNLADLIKFAKGESTTSESNNALSSVVDIVNTTMVTPAPIESKQSENSNSVE